MGVAEAQLHLVQQPCCPDSKVLLQGQAAGGQAPQHLFAALEPELGDHRQQAAQHRVLVQQQAVSAAQQLGHKGVVGLVHRLARAVAIGSQVGQQHLARGAALVEQLPQGLIGGVAQALEQGLAQIEPGASAQLQ